MLMTGLMQLMLEKLLGQQQLLLQLLGHVLYLQLLGLMMRLHLLTMRLKLLLLVLGSVMMTLVAIWVCHDTIGRNACVQFTQTEKQFGLLTHQTREYSQQKLFKRHSKPLPRHNFGMMHTLLVENPDTVPVAVSR